jgi:hypothetical protein
LSRRPPLGAVLFFALLGATLLLGVLVVRARTPDLALEVTTLTREFAPGGAERPNEARIEFFVREDDPAADVLVVNPAGRVMRTLASGITLEEGREVAYRWDGRTDRDRRARPGRYRLRVVLSEGDRDMVWPRRMILRRPAGSDVGEPSL